MALVAGMQAVPDRIMGHSGAFVGPREGDACSKLSCLEDAGAVLTNHPSRFGPEMKKLLEKGSSRPVSSVKIAILAMQMLKFRLA